LNFLKERDIEEGFRENTKMAGIIRITLFKIPAKENQAKLLDLYRTLAASAKKVPLYFFPGRSRKKLTHFYRTENPTSCPWSLVKRTKTNAAKATP
jgi:hypothetical protein